MHEPKGISTAVINKIYKSNGAGSGAWDDVDSSMIQGLSGDAGGVGKILLTNGTNGFTLATPYQYGSKTITNNVIVFPVTAVADGTFNTPSQYSLFTGAPAPWVGESLYGITFNTDSLTVAVTGVYTINLWLNINSFPSSTAKISVRYKINGAAFSSRKPTVKSAVANDVSQLFGFGLVALNAGDYIQICIASDVTGNLVIGDANSSLTLVRQTA